MITHEIIQQMERELKSNLEQLMLAKHETRNERTMALFHSYARKLIESVAEEILSSDDVHAEFCAKKGEQYKKCCACLLEDKRLKVKEIINSISK